MPQTLERIKWLLWYGNLHRTVAAIEDLKSNINELDIEYPNQRKLARTVHLSTLLYAFIGLETK